MQTSTDKYIVLCFDEYGGGWEIEAENLSHEGLKYYLRHTLNKYCNIEVIKGAWVSDNDIKTLYTEAKKENK